MALVDVSCLCGEMKTTVRLVSTTIPAQSTACHQSTCRYNLGALYHSLLPVMDRPETDRLTLYAAQKEVRRYFCCKCGSHVFQESDRWYVQSGAVSRVHPEQVSEALEEIAGHRYVEETLDGGIAKCLREIDRTQNVGSAARNDSSLARGQYSRPVLSASCACGGVEFFLTRPNAGSVVCSSPWPDLIVPYHSHSAENLVDHKWWVRDGDKWLAGTCACKSCRLGLGVPLQSWAFVARSNIFQLDGSPLSYDKLGQLRYFESSPGTRREFCGKCGATVFWHNTGRPGVVDVSVGLLRAEEGTMATTWLSWWTQRCSFAEEALDKPLIDRIESRLSLLEN